MKKTISILMMAMMLLTTGAFAAYANVDGDGNVQDPATDAVAEETTEEPEEESAEPEAEPAEEQAEEVQEDEEVVEEEGEENADTGNVLSTMEATEFTLTQGEVTKAKGAYSTSVSWNEVTSAAKYEVTVNDGEAEDLGTATKKDLSDLAYGTTYTVKVVAKDDTDAELASATITVKEAFPVAVTAGYLEPGWKRIYVLWKASGDAKTYIIERKKTSASAWTKIATLDAATYTTKDNAKDTDSKYKGYFLYADKKTTKDVVYNYRITVVDALGNQASRVAKTSIYSGSQAAGTMEVRQMYIKATFKVSRKLTSHDKYHKTRTFKAGTKIKSLGISSGRYIFEYTAGGKTYTYYVKAHSMKNAKCVIVNKKKWDYSEWAAERFVQDKGSTSSTKWLTWSSLYTQHTYIFKKVNGRWECVKQGECASGSARRATPTGNKKIHQKIKTRHSRKWWSSFSNINSYHSKLAKQGVGKPGSNGCIRMMPAVAKYIYDNCKIGTRAVIY